MHQTFYIDVDEEITSIIERIRKAQMDELVIVIPKGALLIQSIINLKLLKKEADKLGKEIIIVTQDKAGKLLVEKAGISIEQRLEDIEGEKWENVSEEKIEEEKPAISEDSASTAKKDIKKRLDKIGSSDFFENEESKDKEDEYLKSETSVKKKKPMLRSKKNEIVGADEGNEKILNKELVVGLGNDIKKRSTASGMKMKSGSMDMVKNINIKQDNFFTEEGGNKYPKAKETAKNLLTSRQAFFDDRQKKASQEEMVKNEKFEQFLNSSDVFLNRQKMRPQKEKKYSVPSQSINLPSKFWKFFIAFSLLVGIFAFGLFLYLFLPKAKVTVFLKTKSQSLDAEIKGDVKNTSVDISNKAIPAKLVSFTDEITQSFASSGEKSASSRKARGTITIYNEYSTASQSLVATTRFLSADGKLFRLVSGITIPGMTKAGSDLKPGAVEAEVVADEAGDNFNIGPTTFTIPGFQGSGNEKYSKFYAKSFSAMTGGGSSDVMSRAITEQDINSAKNKILNEFNAQIKQKIKNQAGADYLVLDDALSVGENSYKFSNSAGDVTDEFSVTISAKANAIVFSEKDLKEVLIDIMNKISGDDLKISEKTLQIDFGKSDSNLSEGTILIRVHGNGKTESGIDAENLKEGILGKSNEELKAYLGTYRQFSDVEVEYWPAFFGEKIPIYKSRTEVILDNN